MSLHLKFGLCDYVCIINFDIELNCVSGLNFYFDRDPANNTKIISFIGHYILRFFATFR